MNKNFLDTQTGGTSEVSSENKGESQKTDLSPKQVEEIRKASESEPDASKDLNLEINKEQEAQERVEAVESGETRQVDAEVSAEDSTPNKILSEYKDEDIEAQEEKSALDIVYSKSSKESQLSEEDLLDKSELNPIIPMSSVTELTMETPKGLKIPVSKPEEFSYDPDLDKDFREMPDGTFASSLDGTAKDLNTSANFFKKEDQEFVTFEGKPIKKDRVLPKAEKKRLKGEDEEPEPGYYTYKGKRYLKTEDGDWQQIKYREYYNRALGRYVTKEKLMKLNDRHSRILDSNGFFQFSESNASAQLIQDFMYGRENTNIDYSKNKYKAGEEILVQREDIEETVTPGYKNFDYSGDKVSALHEKVKGRKEKYKAKPDGEYQWNGKNFAKKDGKWYKIVKGKDEPTGLLTGLMDRFDIGSDLELKEVKYSDVVEIETESIFSKKSKDYIEKTVYDVVQSFEDKVKTLFMKGGNYVLDSNVDDLVDSDDFKTEPIFDFVNEFTNTLGIDLDEMGFTTAEIERAESQVFQMYGGVLNSMVEKERVKFDLSTEFLFRPNPYDLEAARERVNDTFFNVFIPSVDKKKIKFPLSDGEINKYKGMGYLSENNTFSLPKMPGIYFFGNDYARKTEDGTWIGSNGEPILDIKKRALYESSSYDDQAINTTIGGFTPISAMTFRENEELYSSLKISDDYEVEGKGEKVNVKDLSVYKMIFNDSSLSSFLAESSSSLSSDPYFLELLKAYQSEGDFYSGSDLLKSISNSKDLSGVNLNDVDDYFVSFAYKLEKEIQDYNNYKSSEESLKYFVLNIEKFKYNVSGGVDEDYFDEMLDTFALQAVSILASNLSDNDSKVKRTTNLKREISIWKENLQKTNDLIQEISESGMNVSQYMFANKLKTIQTLGRIGNSQQLEDAVRLWKINKELIDLMQYEREVKLDMKGDAGMGWDYIGSATQQKIKSLEEQSEQYLRQKSVNSVNEKSEIQAKIENIDKAVPFLESIYYEDYKYDDAIIDNYREAGGSYAEIPEDLELTEGQKAELKIRIEILERTKRKLVSDLEENESSTFGFFRTSPRAVVDQLSEGDTQIKSYIAAIPSGEGFSSKDKFDMMFEQMNQRRLKLEGLLNLSGNDISSAVEIRLDKLKDLFFTDMSPAEKEYYQLLYDIRIMTPIYLNNTQATKAEVNGFFNSLWGGIFEFAFPNTSKAAGSFMIGKGRVANISSSPKKQILDIAKNINKMQESKQVEGQMEMTSDASEEFSADVGWAMQEDELWSRDFWGNTLGVTLGIITMFRKASSWRRMGYKGIQGVERLIRKSPKKFESIIAKSLGKFEQKYNAVMARNKITKHLISPSLNYGTQFKITGSIFNDEKVGKELTFAAGAAGGLLSQGFIKGFPFLTRSLAGMTKVEYQAYMRGVFGSKTSSIMRRLNNLSRGAGWGTAETMQETGEELTHAWEDSENGKDFFKVLEQRFGTIDKVTRFAVSTFAMGIAFGIGAQGGLGDAVSNLNEEQFQVYDKVTTHIKAQHDAAVKEAEASRKEYTQNAVNAANAVNSQEAKEGTKEEQVETEEVKKEEQVETEEELVETKEEETTVEKKSRENKRRKVEKTKIKSRTKEDSQVLGENTLEIESERATLTYNKSKSDDTSSIVYDINDETGSTGQVSGNYNKDGDFVVIDINSTRISENFEQEAVEAIAEQIDGDVIISGKSDLGAEMHKNDMVVMDENGDYLLLKEGSQKTGRKRKAGDGIRSFKSKNNQDGTTRNQGPGESLYNAALEVAAKVVDAGGGIAKAVSSARNSYRNSNYYKNLKAEEQINSINQIEIAIKESLTTEEFMELENTTDASVNAAVKEFQKSPVYKNADRKGKARLTKEFKSNLQARIDERVSADADKSTKEKGEEILKDAKKSKTKFEEKVEIKAEILKLKLRAKNLKKGSKAMQDIKSRIIKYIKQNIPTGVKYTASEVKSLVTAVQQAKNAETLEKAFDKVDETVFKKHGQVLSDARKKLKSRLSPKNLRNELTRKKGGKRKAKVDAYTVDALKSYISQLGGMDAVSEMNLDEIKEFNDVLDGIISEGKVDFKAAQKLLHSAKRKAQGGIILGFDTLALQRKNNNVKSISDLKDHLNTRGNFVIIGGKYYTKTDFKENEAEAIREFKDTSDYKEMNADQQKSALENFKNTSGSISFEGLEGDIDFNADDFGAFYSQTPFGRTKVRSKGTRQKINPFTASMSLYELLIKAYSGPLVGSRKGNNSFKDFINKNIAEKMPLAFARTQQQTYEISQEHKAKLEEIFGKGSFNKALSAGEEAFRIMLLGGYASVPSVLRAKADLGKDVLGNRENRVPTNDQVVHIYNMSRNPADRQRLESQKVDVNAIIQYVENNTSSKIGTDLKDYADYLMEFYNNRARELYEDSYEKYTDGMKFDDVEESTQEESTPVSNMAQVIQEGMDFFVSDPLNPPGEMEELNPMSEEEAFRQVEELNKDREEVVEETNQEESIEESQEKTKVRYYPTSAEVISDESKKEQSVMDIITSGGNSSQVSMALNPGSFQEKTGQGNLNLNKGATEIFADYNMQNTRYKNFADITNAVATIYGNQNLTDIMEENMGINAFNKLKTALSDSISGQADMVGQIPMVLSLINSVGVIGTLALKPQQVAKQATSFMHFWNAGIRYGLKGESPGLLMGLVPTNNPFAAAFGLVNSQTRDFEMSLLKSAFVVERWRGGGSSLDLDLRQAQEQSRKSGEGILDVLLKTPVTAATKGVSTISNPLLITTRMGDMAGVLFGPGGGMTFAVNLYNKFKKDGMSHEEAKTRAIEIFQIEATQSQQTTQVDNLSAAQKQVAYRMAGMYRTSQSAAAKRTMRSVNAMFDGTKKSKKEKAQIASDFVYFGMLSPLLFTAVTTGFVMSALSVTGAVQMPAVVRDDEDKVMARHAYDWLADNAQSLIQGYGYGGILVDGYLNIARDRGYFNQVPVLKVIDKMLNGAVEATFGEDSFKGELSKEELSGFENIMGYIGAEKNATQMAELYDLMVADEKDWRKILNKAMGWHDRYLQPALDYGKDDKLFEQVSKMWVEGGEGYLDEVVPILDRFKKQTYTEKGYSNKTYTDKSYNVDYWNENE